MGIRLTSLIVAQWMVVLSACAPAPVEVRSGRERDSFLDVALLDGAHHVTTLAEVVSGRPALVNLWATWCDACGKEFAVLNRLHAEVRGRGRVIGVAVGEPQAEVFDFVREHGLGYVQLVDEEFVFSDALGSKSLPSTLVLDRSGEVRFRGAELDREALEAFQEVIRAL